MVPDDWQTQSVGDLCEFVNGNGFKSSQWSTEGLPIIRIQNLNGSKGFNYFKGEIREKWIVEPGDILFAWAGTKGVSFGAKRWPGPKGVLNQHIFRIKPKQKVDPDWLYSALIRVTERVENKAHGFKATLLHVQKSDITEQVLAVPPVREQQKIAQILSTWDEAIIYKEHLLANSKQQKKALMQQLLTGKKRLPGFGKPGKGGFSRKGLPDGWSYERIANIAEEVADRNKEHEELPVLSCSKYDGFVDSLKYFKKKVYSDDTSNYKLIRCGEFGFPANHVEEGSIGLQSNHDKGIVSPIYVVFRVDPGRVDKFFLYKVLKTDHYRQVFSASTSASVDRRGSLRWKQFSSINVPLPSLKEQKSISRAIRLAEEEEKVLEQSLNRLHSEKKALMQQLLTGKRRVKLSEKETG